MTIALLKMALEALSRPRPQNSFYQRACDDADVAKAIRAYLYEQPMQVAQRITAMQALEALDELESSSRGDEPFNHSAAPVVRAFIESAMLAAPQAQPVAWMHSATGCLSEAIEDVHIADGDEWAIPLYDHPTTVRAVPVDLVSCLRGGRQCDEDGTEIIMSRQACCDAADILESLSAAPQAQPAPEPERPAGVVIFPNDQFREAFRGLIDTGDKP